MIVDIDFTKYLHLTKASCKKSPKHFTGYKNDEKVKSLCIISAKKYVMLRTFCHFLLQRNLTKKWPYYNVNFQT